MNKEKIADIKETIAIILCAPLWLTFWFFCALSMVPMLIMVWISEYLFKEGAREGENGHPCA